MDILYNGVMLPKQLFRNKTEDTKPREGPAQTFNPVSAVKGQRPWVSMTTLPSAALKPKILVLTDEWMKMLNTRTMMTYLCALRNLGFTIYIAYNKSGNQESPDIEKIDFSTIEILQSQLRNSRKNNETDHAYMAETYNTSRDNTCVLNTACLRQLHHDLRHVCTHRFSRYGHHHTDDVDSPVKLAGCLAYILGDSAKKEFITEHSAFLVVLPEEWNGLCVLARCMERFTSDDDKRDLLVKYGECLTNIWQLCECLKTITDENIKVGFINYYRPNFIILNEVVTCLSVLTDEANKMELLSHIDITSLADLNLIIKHGEFSEKTIRQLINDTNLFNDETPTVCNHEDYIAQIQAKAECISYIKSNKLKLELLSQMIRGMFKEDSSFAVSLGGVNMKLDITGEQMRRRQLETVNYLNQIFNILIECFTGITDNVEQIDLLKCICGGMFNIVPMSHHFIQCLKRIKSDDNKILFSQYILERNTDKGQWVADFVVDDCVDEIKDADKRARFIQENKSRITSQTYQKLVGRETTLARLRKEYCFPPQKKGASSANGTHLQRGDIESIENCIRDGMNIADCINQYSGSDQSEIYELLEKYKNKIDTFDTLKECVCKIKDKYKRWKLTEEHAGIIRKFLLRSKDDSISELEVFDLLLISSPRIFPKTWIFSRFQHLFIFDPLNASDQYAKQLTLEMYLGRIEEEVDRKWILEYFLKIDNSPVTSSNYARFVSQHCDPGCLQRELDSAEVAETVNSAPFAGETTTDVVYLYIWIVGEEEAIKRMKGQIRRGEYRNLSFVDIDGDSEAVCDFVTFLRDNASQKIFSIRVRSELIMRCSKIFTPQGQAAEHQVTFEALPMTLPLSLEMGSHASEAPTAKLPTSSVTSAPPPDNRLYINSSKEPHSLGANKTTPTYKMLSVGRILNGIQQTRQRVRTHVVLAAQYSSLDNSRQSTPKPYEPKQDSLQRVANVVSIGNSHKLEEEDPAQIGGRYFEFTLVLAAKHRTRLLSIDANEIFYALVGPQDDDNNVQIYRCERDGFFYATADRTCEISYVVKAPTAEHNTSNFDRMPDENAIKKVINEYLKGISDPIDEFLQPKRGDYNQTSEWLKDMYYHKSGSCEDRVAAVVSQLLIEKDVNSDLIRVVDIDGNHVRLEVYYNSEWIQVKLGGEDAKCIYLPSGTVYNPNSAEYGSDASIPALKVPAPDNKKQQKPPTRHHLSMAVRRLVSKKQTITDESSLDAVLNSVNRHIALSSSDCRDLIIFLSNKKVFYAEDTESLSGSGQSRLLIDFESKVSIVPGSPFTAFIQKATEQGDEPFYICIDWRELGSKTRVALTSLLDKDCRRVQGIALPDNIKIVSLFNEVPSDGSLYFRHGLHEEITPPFRLKSDDTTTKVESECLSVDLLDCHDWPARLFGPIILHDNRPVWDKSPHVEMMEAFLREGQAYNLELKNLPPETHQACRSFFLQARRKGYFDYMGYHIYLPADFTFTIDESEYNFSNFQSQQALIDAKPADVPTSAKVINGQLFDFLVAKKHISEGKYNQQDGYLEAAKGEALSLWITSELSNSQWYYLFNEAKRLNVGLSLYLAPGIRVPTGLHIKSIHSKDQQKDRASSSGVPIGDLATSTTSRLPVIILTDDSSSIKPDNNYGLSINVDDLTYRGLIGGITFETDSDGRRFRNFIYHKSDFIIALETNQPVVLKGRFSDELLQALHPLIVGKEMILPDGSNFTHQGSLSFYFELDSNSLPQKGTGFPELSCRGSVKVLKKDITTTPAPTIIFTEAEPSREEVDLSDCHNQDKSFFKNRCDAVLNALSKHSMIQFIAPTGAGKSSLMDILAQEKSVDVFHGLENFDRWAEAAACGVKLKVLFLDESNIINEHLTFLNPLKEGGNRRVFHNGKVHSLPKNHKVVFARNPHDYGGGRESQRVFADNTIPELHFSDFPSAVMYKRLLLPLYESFRDKLQGDKKEITFSEPEFKEQVIEWLRDHVKSRHSKTRGEDLSTIRSVQQKALHLLLSKIPNQPSTTDAGPATSDDTSETAHLIMSQTKNQRNQIRAFIEIHKAQLGGRYGQNGCSLEGPPGIGKSEMITFMLKECGYREKTQEHQSDQTLEHQSELFYCKIDASLPLSEKEQRIRAAFDEGHAIILDEVNCCSDDGLERILNSVLTGVHPVTGKPPAYPGFMAFFTGNTIAMSGRASLSHALLDRCEKIVFEPIDRDTIFSILNQAKYTKKLQGIKLSIFADDLEQILSKEKLLNLRVLLMLLDTIFDDEEFATYRRIWHLSPRNKEMFKQELVFVEQHLKRYKEYSRISYGKADKATRLEASIERALSNFEAFTFRDFMNYSYKGQTSICEALEAPAVRALARKLRVNLNEITPRYSSFFQRTDAAKKLFKKRANPPAP